MNCPVCDGNKTSFLRLLYDDRYAYPGEFRLLKCRSCHHIFLEHSFLKQEISEIYTNYYPRTSFNLDQHKPHKASGRFISWFNGEKSSSFRWVPKNIRVLDIGCGFGESLGYHARRGCQVYGVDADKNLNRVAKKYGYQVHVGNFDASLYDSDYFDYVTLDQVIEHFIDPKEAIRGVAQILKPGGYAILSTPNVNGWGRWAFKQRWINWHAPYHLQYFSNKSMKRLVDSEGFEVDKIYTITNSDWLYYQWLHLLMYPKSGRPSGFWTLQNKMPKMKRVQIKIITILHKLKINHLITRFFDGIGLGDNRVYILRKR